MINIRILNDFFKDGQSDVMVTAPALETLLTILDARHYYGSYQPNMGLKSAMERVEGANAQLRDQVRLLRQEEERAVAASQRLRSRLAAAEAELKAIKGGFMEQPPSQVDCHHHLQHHHYNHSQVAQVVASPVVAASLPPTISTSAAENVAVLENQLIHVLDELEARESSGRRLETEVATLGKKLAAAKHQVGLTIIITITIIIIIIIIIIIRWACSTPTTWRGWQAGRRRKRG